MSEQHDKQNFMTQEGYDKLKEKLDYYLTTKRIEVSARIAAARDFGDLSENSEYDEAKREQVEVEIKIYAMQEQLAQAVIIDESLTNRNEVSMGSKVVLLDTELNETLEFVLIGSYEADPLAGKMSNISPVGSAILGKRKGYTVRVNSPDGVIEYKIMDILPNR
ncbi:MAG: transcription elongation factor GreA [Alistipes onderdonkii]